jgi:hypothetical protein
MKHNPVNSYYNVYRLITYKKEHVCVAVSRSFEREIESGIKEYGNIAKVQANKTVKGIFLECQDKQSLNFHEEKPENDIVMNQLRPHTSD